MSQLYEQAWSQGNVDVLDEVMSEGHIQRDMVWSGASPEGRAGMQRGVTGYRRWFPDLNFTIKSLVADVEQKICFVEWVAEGTYSGVIEGHEEPGEKESFGGVSALTIENNQIVESRVYRNASQGERRMFLSRMDQ